MFPRTEENLSFFHVSINLKGHCQGGGRGMMLLFYVNTLLQSFSTLTRTKNAPARLRGRH